ncbi:hypothetical protein PPL_11477 [Heterostelium album PN500]|uniref:CS domain-containing protein n=1 Tax=Heterostelium pallidum (strain ATCC 26659 / Pp 5 / PN500) TaxID=670386 RepID=D3BTI1_HETP5|nr:hypothetical protein PPL_11477 [Heterostelium album PN500]EFA75398.1 hypothetical protein PPL_11477 [Heterostelium album PN500]|eukprot:XP_020427532.1 hypothetical protein PPL_11477 [Heterostelium album PN500]
MIVPRFTVEQNNDFIIVVARTPYIKANEADFYLMDTVFKFYCKPYFLRLTFSHSIVENGKEKASYNLDTQEFTFLLPKAVSGQYFSDLDMITKLLDKKKTVGNKIEVLNEGTTIEPDNIDQDQEMDSDDEDEDDELNYVQDDGGEEWEFEQKLSETPSLDEIRNKPHYGFNNKYVGFFVDLQSEITEIIDIPNIDEITKEERTTVRTELENLKFDPDRYMENYYFKENVEELLHYKAFWEDAIEKKKQIKESLKNEKKDNILSVEEKEKTTATTTKVESEVVVTEKKEYNPSNLEEFEELTNETEFEENGIPSEIAQQINSTLSKKIEIVGNEEKQQSRQRDYDALSQLKKVVTFTDEERDIMKNLPNKEYLVDEDQEKSLLMGLVDLMFAYAYNVRSNYGDDNNIESAWTITKVSPTLSSLLGKRCLLKCLLAIRKSLESHEYKYYLNRLYIDDYCVWLQYANKKKLKSLTKNLMEMNISKSDIEWPLEAYEKLVEEEGMVFGGDEDEDEEI